MSAMLAESRRAEATAVVETPRGERKRVVIIGGGFAGIAAAHALRHGDSPLAPRVHLLGAFAVVFATAAVSRQTRGLRTGVRAPAAAAHLAGIRP